MKCIRKPDVHYTPASPPQLTTYRFLILQMIISSIQLVWISMYKICVLKKILEKCTQKTLTLSVEVEGGYWRNDSPALPFFSQKTTKNANNFGKWPIDVHTNKTCYLLLVIKYLRNKNIHRYIIYVYETRTKLFWCNVREKLASFR